MFADFCIFKKPTMPPKKAGKGAKMVTEPPKEKKKKGAKSGKKRKESYAIYIYKVCTSPIALVMLKVWEITEFPRFGVCTVMFVIDSLTPRSNS